VKLNFGSKSDVRAATRRAERPSPVGSKRSRRQSRAQRAKHARCAACGLTSASAQLHGHHITYGRHASLVTLCAKCHRAVHAESREFREPLELVTPRFVATHRRILGSLDLERSNHYLRRRQQILRERATTEGIVDSRRSEIPAA